MIETSEHWLWRADYEQVPTLKERHSVKRAKKAAKGRKASAPAKTSKKKKKKASKVAEAAAEGFGAAFLDRLAAIDDKLKTLVIIGQRLCDIAAYRKSAEPEIADELPLEDGDESDGAARVGFSDEELSE